MAEETILESIENLRGVIERKEVYYKTMISTHEVTISQQTIRIKKLEAQVKELQGWDFENIVDKIYGEQNQESPKDIRIKELEDKLSKAGEVVEDNVQTILRLQHRIKEIEETSQEGWDLAETYASGRGMVKYPFNPVPEDVDSTLLDWPWGEPEPYPFTHPIREIPAYGKVTFCG